MNLWSHTLPRAVNTTNEHLNNYHGVRISKYLYLLLLSLINLVILNLVLRKSELPSCVVNSRPIFELINLKLNCFFLNEHELCLATNLVATAGVLLMLAISLMSHQDGVAGEILKRSWPVLLF